MGDARTYESIAAGDGPAGGQLTTVTQDALRLWSFVDEPRRRRAAPPPAWDTVRSKAQDEREQHGPGKRHATSWRRPGTVPDYDQAIALDPRYAPAYSDRGATRA